MTAPRMGGPSAEAFGFVHRFEPARPGEAGADLTILALHGTGADEHDLIPLARSLAPGAAVLSPRGQVSEHGAPRFFRRLAEGVFDLEDLALRTEALGDFVDGAATRYGIDRNRIVAVGFSNGANIAASALLLHPQLLAGAVLLRAMVPFEPTAPVTLPGTPVYLGAGRFDPIIPPENSARLAALLEQSGARTTLAWQPTGHQLAQPELAQVRDWMAANVL